MNVARDGGAGKPSLARAMLRAMTTGTVALESRP